jgi:hypothetical protein
MHPVLNAYLIEALSADRRRAAEHFRSVHADVPAPDNGGEQKQSADADGRPPAERGKRRRFRGQRGYRSPRGMLAWLK